MPRLTQISLAAVTAATTTFALPAAAVDTRSLWSLFSPDLIAESLMGSVMSALRTQADITYADLAVNMRAGRATITDLVVLSFPTWLDGEACAFDAAQILINLGDPFDPTRVTVGLSVLDLSIPTNCLPPEQMKALQDLGIPQIDIPLLEGTLQYDMPSAGAVMRLAGHAEGLAGFELAVDANYLAVESNAMTGYEPLPVIYLSEASLSLENLGLWAAVSGELPPQLLNPAQSKLLVEGALGSLLLKMNGTDNTGATKPLNFAQRAFLASAADSWSQFVLQPNQLVLQTRIPADDPYYIDPYEVENDIPALFAALQPSVDLRKARTVSFVPSELIAQALSGETDALSPDARRAVGMALLTGDGAPLAPALGQSMIADLAEGGDPEAAYALAQTYRNTDPAAAYEWALVAGLGGHSAALSLMDRLEQDLSMVDVLRIQAPYAQLDQIPATPAQAVSLARSAMTGLNAPRAYGRAMTAAALAASANEPGAEVILDELSRIERGLDAPQLKAWSSMTRAAQTAAVDLWIAHNLAQTFAQ